MKKHGEYHNGGMWCGYCERSLKGQGFRNHVRAHERKGDKLDGNEEAPVEATEKFVAGGIIEDSVVSVFILDMANHIFPADPHLWNAFTIMAAQPSNPKSLKAAAGYLEYKALLLEEEMGVK